jgi:hypothetical protein
VANRPASGFQGIGFHNLQQRNLYSIRIIGIATRETLADGPPSVDLEYVLRGARSAVSTAVPLNKDYIKAYLAKEDRLSHEQDNFRVNMQATGIAAYLAGPLPGAKRTSFPRGDLQRRLPGAGRKWRAGARACCRTFPIAT